jgi:hypothetical protein
MAIPKQAIKKDPSAVISARVRMAPVDQSVVLAKMGDDTVVKCMGLNKYAIGSLFDGREVMIEKEGLRVSDDRGRMVAQPLDASVKLYKTLIDAATRLMTIGTWEIISCVSEQPRNQKPSQTI